MDIVKNAAGSELTVSVIGRLDTTTAPELEADFSTSLSGVSKLVLDFSSLEYISSAGLRVILAAKKTMTKQGGDMVVRGANDDIKEVFDITGFSEIITIE